MQPRKLSAPPSSLFMTRRQVVTALSLTLTTPLTSFLAGCGGGKGVSLLPGGGSGNGGGTTSLSVRVAQGKIVLPSGSPLQITRVSNLFSTSVPRTDGTFDYLEATETPLLTMAYGQGGDPVLYGFLPLGGTELSARSTAIVLGYLFLGVGAYPEEVQAVYLDEIARASSLTGLENAIASAISARGEAWLDENDGGLTAALSAVQLQLSAQAFATRGVILDKTDRVSGLQVKADGISSMTITNYYRRRSYVYVDRVSYKVKGTGESIPSPAPISPQPIKITPVKGISNAPVVLGQFLGGQRDFYEGITTSPISIPVHPTDAASTTYTATAVGIGGSPGDFGKLTTTQQDGWWEVTVTSMLFDLVAPAIAGVVIPNFNKDIGNFVEFAAAGGFLKDIINALVANGELRNKAKSGRLADVAWDTLLLIVKSDTLKNLFLHVVSLFLENAFTYVADPNNATFFQRSDKSQFVADSSKKLLGFISKINIGLQFFDSVISGVQIAYCNNADVFTLEVTNAIARLNPETAFSEPTQEATEFTAVVTNADAEPGAQFSYTWSCACKFGSITDGPHNNITSGTRFDSSLSMLRYTPNGSGVGGDTEVITVEIFKGGIHNRVAIGTATSTVHFRKVTISPESKTLAPDKTVTLTADIQGVPPLPDGQKIVFRWTTTRNAGELIGSPDGGAVIPVEAQTVTFRASSAQTGVDTVMVEAFLGSTRLGSAKATIDVEVNEQIVGSELVYENYLASDFAAANLPFNNAATGAVIVSLVFRREHDTGYYLVRTTPNALGQRVSYKFTVADFLQTTSLSESEPPSRGAPLIPTTIVETIPGLPPIPTDVLRRRGNKIYFYLADRQYPFYPSVVIVTDAAGSEAWLRQHAGNGTGVEIVWKNE